MVRNLGAQVALLAFVMAILAGLSAGNAPVTILARALAAMLIAWIVGQAVAWVARLVLRDHLQRKKLVIDREHLDATRAAPETPAAPPETG